jgi:hypothetical protein
MSGLKLKLEVVSQVVLTLEDNVGPVSGDFAVSRHGSSSRIVRVNFLEAVTVLLPMADMTESEKICEVGMWRCPIWITLVTADGGRFLAEGKLRRQDSSFLMKI